MKMNDSPRPDAHVDLGDVLPALIAEVSAAEKEAGRPLTFQEVDEYLEANDIDFHGDLIAHGADYSTVGYGPDLVVKVRRGWNHELKCEPRFREIDHPAFLPYVLTSEYKTLLIQERCRPAADDFTKEEAQQVRDDIAEEMGVDPETLDIHRENLGWHYVKETGAWGLRVFDC